MTHARGSHAQCIIGRMANSIVLQLEPGDAFSGSDFVFRVDDASATDFVRELQEAGFDAEIPISHSARPGVEVLVTFLTAAGGLAGLAKVLETWLARHENKTVVLADGTRISGFDASDLTTILANLPRPTQETRNHRQA